MLRLSSPGFGLLFAGSLLLGGLEARAVIPLVIHHQGVVQVDGALFDGSGAFRFAFVDGTNGNNLWTNDGTALGTANAPSTGISIAVTGGRYAFALGSTPTVTLSSSVFDGDDVALRIWFDDGVNGLQQLMPDQPVTSVAYAFSALRAEKADIADAVAPDGIDTTMIASGSITAADLQPGASLIDIRSFDGSGSLLDADLLDGLDSTSFVQTGSDTFVRNTGDTLDGDLEVTGNVAIGGGFPADEDLYVAGEARVAGTLTVEHPIAYQFPQLRRFSLTGEAFVPQSAVPYSNMGGNGGAYIQSGVGSLVAPVHIPEGALITGFIVTYYDNSDSDIVVNLTRLAAQGVYETLSTVTSSGSQTFPRQVAADSVENGEVNNFDYGYFVSAYCDDWDSANLRVKHICINYTEDEVL